MPNTLGHFGVQGAASRALFGSVDPRWIMAGCVLPDVPWILQRVAQAAFPGAYPYDLRLYFVAQASLFGALVGCGAAAAFAPKPRRIFLLLAFNSLLHLLLDACQTKWGNGVHLLAPASWHMLNFGWFWPADWPSHALTAAGVVFLLWASRHGLWAPFRLTFQRWAIAGILVAAYFCMPALQIRSAYVANVHDARVLKEQTVGAAVAFDREEVVLTPGGPRLEPWNGRQYAGGGGLPETPGTVSLRGRISAPEALAIEELHEHSGSHREYGSLVGLGVLAAAIAVGLWRSRNLQGREPSKQP